MEISANLVQSVYFTFRQDKIYSSDCVLWRCSHSKCRNKISLREKSWFSGIHLSLDQVIKLIYYWVYKLPLEFIARELKKIGSEQTIVDWCQFARDVCIGIIKSDNEQIGRPGIVIEESKFGKRKYHRGKRVDGVWVFGGIERDSKRCCFFLIAEDRSAPTLISIIKPYVKPGSIILSDCWKAYSSQRGIHPFNSESFHRVQK